MPKLTMTRPVTFIPGAARELDEMQNRMRRFFHEPFWRENVGATDNLGWIPAVEVTESPEELLVAAELPGMKRENVEVLFENDTLTIRGEKKEEKTPKDEKDGGDTTTYHVWERAYGAFQRSFTLPRTIDATKVSAEFKDGVLKVHLPKLPAARAKGTRIAIADN